MSLNDWLWMSATLLMGGLVGYVIGEWHATKRAEILLWQMQMEIQSYARMMLPDESDEEWEKIDDADN